MATTTAQRSPLIARLPSLAAGLASAIGFVRELRPSEYPQIFIWSRVRFGLLIVLLACSAYFLWSLFRPKLALANNYLFFMLAAVGVGLEGVMRIQPSLLVPPALFPALPEAARRQVGNVWGFYTRDSVTGSGMVFHYKPHEKLPQYPYVRIDGGGYRNPVDDIRRVDVVLLGDSVTAALAAEKDMGALFREDGHEAINLATGNYTPQHYRDTYKTLVVQGGIQHATVLTFLTAANDFSSDVTHYADVVARGGDYVDFLSSDSSENRSDAHVWIVSLTRALPAYLAQRFYYARPRKITLPYKTMESSNVCPPVAMRESSVEWPLVRDALDEIVDLAREMNARPVFVLVPPPATVYAKYGAGFAAYDRQYAVTSATLGDHFKTKGVQYLDLNDPLKHEAETQPLFGPSDCHFDTQGVATAYRIVRSALDGAEAGLAR